MEVRWGELLFSVVNAWAESKTFQLNFPGSEKLSGQWPGWRGWNTGGVSDENPLPDVLNATTEVWKVKVGSGHSSPVIWNDLIFLTVVNFDQAKPYLIVRAIEKSSGKIRWSKSLQWMTGRLHPDNSYASHTVATDGNAVFVTSGFYDSNLYALAVKDGAILWKQSLGSMDHEYGTSVGPIVYRDKVIQLCDSEFSSSLKAFDRKTGKLLWSTPRVSTGSWGTPAIVRDSDKTFTLVVPGGGAASGGGRLDLRLRSRNGERAVECRGHNGVRVSFADHRSSPYFLRQWKNGRATLCAARAARGEGRESVVGVTARRGLRSHRRLLSRSALYDLLLRSFRGVRYGSFRP